MNRRQDNSVHARATRLHLLAAVGVIASAAPWAAADIFKVANSSNDVRTFSDLYAFDTANNQGKRTDVLKRGDATDDINIAGKGVKNLTVPDGSKSFTVSWMGADGVERETDTNLSGVTLAMASFDTPGFAGLAAIAYGDLPGALPDVGFAGLVTNGKLQDPIYDWITFYDASASDGFILRDGAGVPISPLLDGASVQCVFHYELSVIPSPSALATAALAGLLAIPRRRR